MCENLNNKVSLCLYGKLSWTFWWAYVWRGLKALLDVAFFMQLALQKQAKFRLLEHFAGWHTLKMCMQLQLCCVFFFATQAARKKIHATGPSHSGGQLLIFGKNFAFKM